MQLELDVAAAVFAPRTRRGWSVVLLLLHADFPEGGNIVNKWSRVIIAAVALNAIIPVAAQPTGRSAPKSVRADARFNVLSFDNFFWATQPSLERDVTALGLQLRGAYRWSDAPAEVYGHAAFTNYLEEDLDNAWAARAGVAQNGDVHDFNVYGDYSANRPSTAVRDTFSTSDVVTFAGMYAYQLVPAWQIGAEALHERQRFSAASDRANEFTGAGALVRYTGLGYRITPLAGLALGQRDVRKSGEDYDERTWRIGVELVPRDSVWIGINYRNIDRDFERVPSRSFERSETDSQWELIAAYTTARRIQWSLYYSRDDVDVSGGSDFGAQILLVGVGYAF